MATLVNIKNAILKLVSGSLGKSLQVDLETEAQNNDDAEMYHLPGVFSKPVNNTVGVMLDVNGLNIVIATNTYEFDRDLDKGEIIIYSLNENKEIVSSIVLNKSGEMIINAGEKSAVSFEKLKEGFDQFVDDYNNELNNIATAISGAGGSYTPTPTNAEIEDSEVPEVKLP